MSSVLSLFTQQAKETLGVASKTQDADLLALMSRLFDLDKDAQSMKKSMVTLQRVLLEQVPAARSQAGNVLNDIFGRLVPGGSSTTEALASFNDAAQALNKDVVKKMEAAFEKAVMGLLDEWLEQITTTKKDLADVETKRVGYDHYRSKLESLQEAKRKNLLRGRALSKVEEERISRNQDKLQSASAEYFTSRDAICGRILQLLREAPQRVETVLLRTLQFDKELQKDCFVAVQRYEGVLPGLLLHVKTRTAETMAAGTLEACVDFARAHREAEKPIPGIEGNSPSAVETALRIPIGPGAVAAARESVASAPGGKRPSVSPAASAGAGTGAGTGGAPLQSVNSFSSVATTPAASIARGSNSIAAVSKKSEESSWDAAFNSSSSSGNGNDGGADDEPSGLKSSKQPGGAAATAGAASRVSTTQATTGSFFSKGGNPFGPAPTKAAAAAASTTFGSGDEFGASSSSFSSSGDATGSSGGGGGGGDPWGTMSPPPPPPPAAISKPAAPAPAPAPAPTNPFSPGFGGGGGGGGGNNNNNSLGAPPAAGRRRTTATPAPSSGGNPFGPGPGSGSSSSFSGATPSRDPFGSGVGAAPPNDEFNNAFNAAATATAAAGSSPPPVPPPRSGGGGGFDFLAPSAPPSNLPPPSAPPLADPNDPFGGLM